MTGGLTHKQAECLAFVRRYIAGHRGASPSYAEIAEAMGIAKSRVHNILSNLRAHGFVAWDHRQARSLTIVDDNAPYTTDALTALPTATLEAIAAVAATELACRRRDAVLASPSCPAMERQA